MRDRGGLSIPWVPKPQDQGHCLWQHSFRGSVAMAPVRRPRAILIYRPHGAGEIRGSTLEYKNLGKFMID